LYYLGGKGKNWIFIDKFLGESKCFRNEAKVIITQKQVKQKITIGIEIPKRKRSGSLLNERWSGCEGHRKHEGLSFFLTLA